MRYRAVISYLGTRYVGWQRQLNGLSVQEALENALEKTFGTPTQATASGRTDAGVHAEGQVVHFDADTTIPTEKIPFAVNTHLPDDISMLKCEIVDSDFNARFSAKRKTYCYKLYISKHRLPLLEPTHEQVVVPLDLTAMQECARVIEGEHDFKCFEASGSVVKNTVRTVYSIDIDVKPLSVAHTTIDEENTAQNYADNCAINNEKTDILNGSNCGFTQFTNGNSQCVANDNSQCVADDNSQHISLMNAEVEISVTGNGFLYNMVRIIAGTLVYVGIGKLTVEDVKDIIASGDRKRAGKTLSAKGLHLIKVIY